ncbi:MAG: nucleotidyltransferase domain-containing protein [candidate division KSB1 bacterium]|nr:nucleotidyltransferase domain-containing protein [candidate division KSB1 bacterium]
MNKYKYLTNKETQALDLLIRNLRRHLKDQLVRIQLFGSKTKGNFSPDSDIDVLLIVRQRTEEVLERIAELHLKVDLKYDPHISLIIFSEHEYLQNEAFESPFIKNINREGILL